jgi:hypothetical protein
VVTFEEIVPGYRPAKNPWTGSTTFGPSGEHGRLQRDLAAWLREAEYLTFTEIQVAERLRVDVVALKPSYARLDVRAYEVKANRADLARGLADPKWLEYRDHFHRVIFAFPAGIARADEVPEECGVVLKTAKGWHHVRPGRRSAAPKLGLHQALALLFRGYEEHRAARDLRTLLSFRKGGDVDLQAVANRAGNRIASMLRAKENVLEAPLEELRAIVEEALGRPLRTQWDVDGARGEIAHLLGILKTINEDAEALARIGHYLAGFGLRWGDRLADLRRYALDGLPKDGA